MYLECSLGLSCGGSSACEPGAPHPTCAEPGPAAFLLMQPIPRHFLSSCALPVSETLMFLLMLKSSLLLGCNNDSLDLICTVGEEQFFLVAFLAQVC